MKQDCIETKLKLPAGFEYLTFAAHENPELIGKIGRLRLRVWKDTGLEMVLHLKSDK
jgi:hypothetical protein